MAHLRALYRTTILPDQIADKGHAQSKHHDRYNPYDRPQRQLRCRRRRDCTKPGLANLVLTISTKAGTYTLTAPLAVGLAQGAVADVAKATAEAEDVAAFGGGGKATSFRVVFQNTPSTMCMTPLLMRKSERIILTVTELSVMVYPRSSVGVNVK